MKETFDKYCPICGEMTKYYGYSCTRCINNGVFTTNSTIEVRNIIEVKQLTIEELEAIFFKYLKTKSNKLPESVCELKGLARNVFIDRFNDYRQCAIDCGILKQ